jgi:hypothetical protein
MTMETTDYMDYTFLRINLKVKASLSSVVTLRLHHVLVFCLWATIVSTFKISKYSL